MKRAHMPSNEPVKTSPNADPSTIANGAAADVQVPRKFKIELPKKLMPKGTSYLQIGNNFIPVTDEMDFIELDESIAQTLLNQHQNEPLDNQSEDTALGLAKEYQKLVRTSNSTEVTCENGFADQASFNGDDPLQRSMGYKYLCEKCDERFCFPTLFEDHINMHTGAQPHRCITCNRRFSTMHQLSAHETVHKAELETAATRPFCGDGNAAFKRHVDASHAERKRELCSYCGNMYLDVQKHIEKCHEKNYGYQCPQCNKKFASSSYLSIHMDKHSEVKRYRCDLCDKRFTFLASLRSHKATHAPVTCAACGKEFGSQVAVKKHARFCKPTVQPTTTTAEPVSA